MGGERPRLEFGVELATEEPWVAGDLHDLHETIVRRQAGDPQSLGGERIPVVVVELVPVTGSLRDLGDPVCLQGERVVDEPAGGGPQPPRRPPFLYPPV